MMIMEKLCTRCKTVKPLSSFGIDRKKRDGLNIWCFTCKRAVGKQHRDKYPTETKSRHRKRRSGLKIGLFMVLAQFACIYCGFSVYAALQFEHKNGTGSLDKRRFKNQERMHEYYIKHPEEAKRELQVTCANCNWIKRFKENGQVSQMRRGTITLTPVT